ncbi:hypothetical protein [Paenibacillus sp. 1P03SA]|uniref:hypothetical protein n=1 Tax=Paenibacillus sp. 1P03SA TaxID=3132294 RepID=UPI0039A2153E
MSIITNRGKAAKESASKKKVDYKKLFIKLKDGESRRVRIPSDEDYVEYMAHGSFDLGVYTQPCLLPAGGPCAFDELVRYINDDLGVTKDDEDHPLHSFRSLYAKKRYLFALYDLDEQMLRFFDATLEQGKALIASIEEYKESLSELAFTFKRTGDKSATSYTLSPILKMNDADKEKFAAFDGVIDENLYEEALMPRTYEQQVDELRRVGLPADVIQTLYGGANEDESKPIEEEDPSKGF